MLEYLGKSIIFCDRGKRKYLLPLTFQDGRYAQLVEKQGGKIYYSRPHCVRLFIHQYLPLMLKKNFGCAVKKIYLSQD
jgi:hypothetical protein